jgi:hypothetical protein
MPATAKEIAETDETAITEMTDVTTTVMTDEGVLREIAPGVVPEGTAEVIVVARGGTAVKNSVI